MWTNLKGKLLCLNPEASNCPKTVSLATGYLMVLNYTFGNSFLGSPFIFYHSGMFGTISIVLFIVFLEWNSARWLFEVMSRAQALEAFKREELSDMDMRFEEENNIPAPINCVVTTGDHPKYEITITRKFELVELCQIFVGRWFKVLYLLVAITASFIALWAYSTVAGSAWAANLPLNSGPFRTCPEVEFRVNIYPKEDGCLASYKLCVFLFAVVVLPVSLLDLKNAGPIQIFFGLLRFIIIGSMILYALVNIAMFGFMRGDSVNGTLLNINASTGDPVDFVLGFSFTGWISAISFFTSALVIHPGLAALTHPIKQKKGLGWFVLILYCNLALFYILIGVVLTLWFGAGVNSTVTLNWIPVTKPGHSLAIRILGYFIVLVPSFISAYPLVVHFTSNNIFMIVMGKDTSQITSSRERMVLLLIKAVYGVLPLVVALFISNLVFVLKYAGLVAFITSCVFPALLQLASQRKCAKVFEDEGKEALELQSIREARQDADTIGAEEGVPIIQEQPSIKKKGVCTTPYSLPLLSHPIAAIAQLCVGGLLFVAAAASVAFQN